jgi:outer membrane biosynthesis protein TonB
MTKHSHIGTAAALLSLIMHFFIVGALSFPLGKSIQANSAKQNVVSIHLVTEQSIPGKSSPKSETNSSNLQSDLIGSAQSNILNGQENFAMLSQQGDNWAYLFPQLTDIPVSVFQFQTHDDRSNYYHSSELQSHPEPKVPVIIPFPDVALESRKASAILVLFIGADGKVEHIDFDKSDLPAEFEKVAMDTFMKAEMRPGIKDGVPVPSRMRVQVEFEAK